MAENVEDILRKAQQEAQARADDAHKRREALMAQVDREQAAIDKARAKQDEAAAQIRTLDEAEVIPAREEVARLSRALGGRGLGDNPA